jgi:hypothetical protein
MPKMRGVKPELWTDDKMVQVSPLARLLFIGMWNYACDNGHVENKPTQLKMRVLPADDANVPDLLNELVQVGCVLDRGDHLVIPALPIHQRIDKRYFTSCDHCAPHEIPEGHNVRTTGARRAHNVDPTGARAEGRKEVKEGEGESDAAGKARKAHQLPDTFRPTAKHMELAGSLGVDLRSEFAQFVDHHRAKGSTMKDWDAALRTWIRNAQRFGRGGSAPLAAVDDPSQLPPVEQSWMRR